ncbi:MAG TPA: glucose-6-phosphate dehydrogenase assembly protein OpcA [Candidatus Saccharimonadales bacterium]|nr:glucose-6-phosphate dehydrogenase assembly protein OpcA [Candidatus Saccharimonadales bacterium]
MRPGETLKQLLAGERKAVDVAAIEAELAALWRSAARSARRGAGGGDGEAPAEAVTRACLWNLVAHALDGAAADALQEELARLSVEVPARVVLVRTDAAAPEDHIAAWIQANCHLAEGGRGHVCTEEIVVAARGRTMSELPSLVRALLAPDVPSALLWLAPPSLAGRHLADWLTVADRFVFDSAGFGAGPEWGGLQAALGAAPRPARPGDLNWRRLQPWRVLTSRLYDCAEVREALLDATTLALAGPGAQRAAALYAGWYGARLGLPVGRAGLERARGPRLAVELPVDGPAAEGPPAAASSGVGAAEAGELERVEFRGGSGTVQLRREGQELVGQLVAGGADTVPLRARAGPRERVALLALELEDYAGDPRLAEALPGAAALVE